MKISPENISRSFLSDIRFNQLSSGSDRESIEKIGEEFEAMFVVQMLKQARESKLSEGLFDSSSEDTYASLLDHERARKIASEIDFGIAEAIARTYAEKSK